MSESKIDLLTLPFDDIDIEWRPGRAGGGDRAKVQCFAYAQPRAYMERLDSIDPHWSVTYTVVPDPSRAVIIARVAIDGIFRESMGEDLLVTNRGEAENPYTSAEAQAFKRACTAHGLGRYLYYIPRECSYGMLVQVGDVVKTYLTYDSIRKLMAVHSHLAGLLRNEPRPTPREAGNMLATLDWAKSTGMTQDVAKGMGFAVGEVHAQVSNTPKPTTPAPAARPSAPVTHATAPSQAQTPASTADEELPTPPHDIATYWLFVRGWLAAQVGDAVKANAMGSTALREHPTNVAAAYTDIVENRLPALLAAQGKATTVHQQAQSDESEWPGDADAPTEDPPEGWCPIHSVQMRQFEKEGRTWYSHKTDEGAWCKGK